MGLCELAAPFSQDLFPCAQNFASAAAGMRERLGCESWLRGRRK